MLIIGETGWRLYGNSLYYLQIFCKSKIKGFFCLKKKQFCLCYCLTISDVVKIIITRALILLNWSWFVKVCKLHLLEEMLERQNAAYVKRVNYLSHICEKVWGVGCVGHSGRSSGTFMLWPCPCRERIWLAQPGSDILTLDQLTMGRGVVPK